MNQALTDLERHLWQCVTELADARAAFVAARDHFLRCEVSRFEVARDLADQVAGVAETLRCDTARLVEQIQCAYS